MLDKLPNRNQRELFRLMLVYLIYPHHELVLLVIIQIIQKMKKYLQ